ncbi:MAG TPA: hypothetical protein VFC44_00020 [Candidatus Saccharimonadales bacterium]|nr:hypothetical protein [Candidatus Saccharimonadales bacterium]
MKPYRPFWWMMTVSSICVVLATFGFWELFASDGVGVTWLLFAFSMLGCGGFGFALTLLAIPIRERILSVPGRILLFGVSVGLLWSLAPGGLSLAFEVSGIPTVLIASGLSGVAVSFALYKPLMKAGRVGAFFLGIIALPVGAFCFGLWDPVIYFITHGVSMAPSDGSLMPLTLGVQYAVFSVITGYAELLIPLALLTTFILRAVILYKADGSLRGEATKIA